jgi:predicted kinase
MQTWQIVCPDDIRTAMGHEFYGPIEPLVWAITETQVRASLIRDRKVLVDATNITKNERRKWKRVAEEFSVPVRAFVFHTPITICMYRARVDERQHMIPVIERMAKKYEAITEDEAFKLTYMEHNTGWF